ncbi:MAG: hypothetical protein ACM33T_00425 [Solirubrobacterales bacterium]
MSAAMPPRIVTPTPMPEVFAAAATALKGQIDAETPDIFQADKRADWKSVIDSLLASNDIAIQATKALAVSGGQEVLHTLLEAAIHLPEQIRAADTRPPGEKERYLEELQNKVGDLLLFLETDQPRASELDVAKETPGQWPPHPFYRDSVLDDLFTEPFRVDRILELADPGDADKPLPVRMHLPFSKLRRLLTYVRGALDPAIAAAGVGTTLNKGGGALRVAVYALDDALQCHDDLFAANPRRLSRNGLIAAFVRASCQAWANFSVKDFSHKEVSEILQARKRHQRERQSAKQASNLKSRRIQ